MTSDEFQEKIAAVSKDDWLYLQSINALVFTYLYEWTEENDNPIAKDALNLFRRCLEEI
jgi:hypothetical protein